MRSLLARAAALLLSAAALAACGADGGGGPATCADDCLFPPTPFCDGDSLVSFAVGSGQCVAGACVFPPIVTPCEAGCSEGRCEVVVDPCDGVTCDSPPSPACDGDVATTYAEAGACDPDSGACSYPPTASDCAQRGLVCRDGACVEPPVDPCEGVTCEVPPARCDRSTAVVATGSVCVDGACVVEETRTDCVAAEQICEDGACVAPPVDLCLGVSCTTPPAPGCVDAGIAIEYTTPGLCNRATGACEWAERRLSCTAAGEICVDGECEPPDPCLDVVCDSPPAAACDGLVAVTYPPGLCERGRCAYTGVRTNCAAGGDICVDGACVAPPCGACDPPAATCDGDTRVVASDGACNLATETCEFTLTRTDCAASGQRCVGGLCVEADPCAGLVCDSPPADTCDGAVATRYAPSGSCAEGSCTYAASLVDCAVFGGRCLDGACVAPDPCDGVVCDSPPADLCDGDVLTEYSTGSCVAGTCVYSPATTDCAAIPGGFCFDNACRSTDPCFGVSCDEAPPADCDGEIARAYAAPGTCSSGRCFFTPTLSDCNELPEGYCADGACLSADPCFGVPCDEAPAATCDLDVLVTFVAPGECSGGRCLWDEVRTDCTASGDVCAGGACRDPDACIGVVCNESPAPTCDGQVAVAYESIGTCRGGVCSYAEVRDDCGSVGQACVGGACVADPCAGVSCDPAPAPVCDGSSVRSFIAPGTCGGGTCSFTSTLVDCADSDGICVDGACITVDPCEDITCDDPPPSRCEGSVAVEVAAGGTCAGGVCTWPTTSTNCTTTGRVCRRGACVEEDPCETLLCNTPAAPRCEGTDVVYEVAPGACAGGFCSYDEARIDCALAGATCIGGACVADPCAGLDCDTPPSPTCDGDTVRTPFGDGQCVAGACRFSETTENCRASGGVCVDGACETVDLCAIRPCGDTPPGSCAGEVATRFVGAPTCEDGICSWATQTEDCAATGRFCNAGQCEAVDPCTVEPCNDPPDDTCIDGAAVRYGLPAVCAAGECTYAELVDDCAARGEICVSGACIVDLRCSGVACLAPPAPSCATGVATRFETPGTCDDGLCTYARVTERCSDTGRFCLNGACVDADPCAGVDCTPMAEPRCEGAVAVRETMGTCVDGTCSYPEERIDCGDTGRFCLAGTCVDADPCEGVACLSPPADACANGLTRLTFDGVGACDEGACTYSSLLVDCSAAGEVCEDGACVPGDVCAELSCVIPPPPGCDGTDRVRFVEPAACVAEECVWAEERFDCAILGGFCADGRCVADDPCDGVDCSSPPPPTCADGFAITFATGACASGACNWAEIRTDCRAAGQFCDDGACVAADPCLGVTCTTPPAARCDDDIRVESLLPGSCVDGACRYTLGVEVCGTSDEICVDGACVPDPCDGVTCTGRPAPTCVGNVARAALGDGCVDGACTWPITETNCAALGLVCEAGACVPDDPCDGVACTAPPESFCSGSDTIIRYALRGTCDDGDCTYTQVPGSCRAEGGVCVLGECVPDPCDDIVCDETPPPFCNGDRLVAFADGGVCDGGVCVYVPGGTVTDCSLSGRICESGACVLPSPCSGIECFDPPEPRCDGNTSVSYLDVGECDEGRCIYEEQRTRCELIGQFCERGTCVLLDPCVGVVCPPATPRAYCEGSTAVAEAGAPVCEGGDCAFADTTRTDCRALGQFCDDGACVAEDPCLDVICDTPPAPFCDILDFAVSYRPDGYCVDNRCIYRTIVTQCAADGLICAGGSCDVGACDGVTCPAFVTECDGDVLESAYGPFACDPFDGTCQIPSDPETFDCSVFGLVCYGGDCRPTSAVVNPGEVVITELLATPASGDPLDQWIEVRNRTDAEVEIGGYGLRDSLDPRRAWQFPIPTFIPAGGYVVVSSGVAVDGLDDALTWGGPSRLLLTGAAGRLQLVADETVISEIAWSTGFADAPGIAAQLGPAGEDDASNPLGWCDAESEYDGANAGTPGDANRECVEP